MKKSAMAAVLVSAFAPCLAAQKPAAGPLPESLLQVKRIYVAPLSGGAGADALRDLIISSLNSTKLFVLTDNKNRADAILKGAAADHTYVQSHDMIDGATGRGGINLTNGTNYSKQGIGINTGGGDNEAYHSKELKHDAFAAVRLCNRDGDIIWSATEESGGGKFRGASEDVAAKVARQIAEDFEAMRQTEIAKAAASQPGKPKSAPVP